MKVNGLLRPLYKRLTIRGSQSAPAVFHGCWRAITVLVMLSLGACCTASLSPAPEPLESTWTTARHVPARGVVILVHGMNVNPRMLQPLASALADDGFHTYRVVLTGHEGVTPSSASAQQWLDDLEHAMRTTRDRFPALKVHMVGYSLGGLLIARSKSLKADSLILIAPALSLRTTSHLARLFGVLAPLGISIPSLAPQSHRRYPKIPAQWYSNLFTLLDEEPVPDTENDKGFPPALVILNRDDELVSPTGIESWIQEQHLNDRWSVAYITPAPEGKTCYQHLAIDQECLGPSEWQRLKELIAEHLRRF